MAEYELDATGLRCPIPVLKARKMMKSLTTGDILKVTATDPGAKQDFQNFCETTGYRLLSLEEQGGLVVVVHIEKPAA